MDFDTFSFLFASFNFVASFDLTNEEATTKIHEEDETHEKCLFFDQVGGDGCALGGPLFSES